MIYQKQKTPTVYTVGVTTWQARIRANSIAHFNYFDCTTPGQAIPVKSPAKKGLIFLWAAIGNDLLSTDLVLFNRDLAQTHRWPTSSPPAAVLFAPGTDYDKRGL